VVTKVWIMRIATLLTILALSPLTAKEIHLDVTNMVCPMCSGKVTQTLQALEGADNAYVDLANGLAVIQLDEDSQLTPEAAAAAVDAVGFPVTAKTLRVQGTTELMAKLEAALGQPLPVRPSSVTFDRDDAPRFARLTISPTQWADWDAVVSESETPLVTLLADAPEAWAISPEMGAAYDWPAAEASMATNAKHSLLVLKL